MRARSRLVPAQLGLLLALAVVLAAFRVEWAPAPLSPRPASPPTERSVILIDLPATREPAPPLSPPPLVAPPVEGPDETAVEEELARDVELPVPAFAGGRSPSRPVEPPPVPADPPRSPEPAEDFVEVPDVMPALVGGLAAFQETVAYPRLCREAGIEGRVFLRFIVRADGTVSDVEVVRGIGGGCDEAAAEALERARFTPGLQRGRPMHVRMALPVTFRLR